MSAVPKKKLCWNCEGNVAKNIDNCPYCGVYLHSAEIEDCSAWNPSYRPSSKTEEISSPLYQIKLDSTSEISGKEELSSLEHTQSVAWHTLFAQLKKDVFPILFLMMGSVFFLFGVVLFLFSQNGTFTLQWKEDDGIYFLLSSIPLVIFGWIFLQKLETND